MDPPVISASTLVGGFLLCNPEVLLENTDNLSGLGPSFTESESLAVGP